MFLLTIWLGTTIIFIIPRLAPGDPVAAMVSRMINQSGYIENSAQLIESWRKKFGLDDPMYIQYLRYLWNMIRFDMGYSLSQFPQPVVATLRRGLPWTIGLLSVATLLSFFFGNLIGALLGWRRTPKWLKRILPLSLSFTSSPSSCWGSS